MGRSMFGTGRGVGMVEGLYHFLKGEYTVDERIIDPLLNKVQRHNTRLWPLLSPFRPCAGLLHFVPHHRAPIRKRRDLRMYATRSKSRGASAQIINVVQN